MTPCAAPQVLDPVGKCSCLDLTDFIELYTNCEASGLASNSPVIMNFYGHVFGTVTGFTDTEQFTVLEFDDEEAEN